MLPHCHHTPKLLILIYDYSLREYLIFFVILAAEIYTSKARYGDGGIIYLLQRM